MESTLLILSTLTEETVSSESVLFAFFGLFIWEIFQTWDVEYNVLSAGGFRRFPVLQFVLCRLFTFGALLGSAIWHTTHREIGCKGLYQFVSFSSDMSIAMTLGLLATNIITTCNDLPLVKFPLVCLSVLSSASLFLHTFIASPGRWDAPSESCVRLAAEGARAVAIRHAAFFAPFAVALVLLVAAFVSVLGRPRKASVSVIGYLLFDNGLIYYVVVVIMLAFPAILNAVRPNVDVDGIAVAPAFVLSAIAATRLTCSHDQTGTSKLQRRATATADIFIHTASFVATDSGGLPATSRGANRGAGPRGAARYNRPPLPIPASALVAERISPCVTPLPIEKDEESVIGHDGVGNERRWSRDSSVTKELSIKFAH